MGRRRPTGVTPVTTPLSLSHPRGKMADDDVCGGGSRAVAALCVRHGAGCEQLRRHHAAVRGRTPGRVVGARPGGAGHRSARRGDRPAASLPRAERQPAGQPPRGPGHVDSRVPAPTRPLHRHQPGRAGAPPGRRGSGRDRRRTGGAPRAPRSRGPPADRPSRDVTGRAGCLGSGEHGRDRVHRIPPVRDVRRRGHGLLQLRRLGAGPL